MLKTLIEHSSHQIKQLSEDRFLIIFDDYEIFNNNQT